MGGDRCAKALEHGIGNRCQPEDIRRTVPDQTCKGVCVALRCPPFPKPDRLQAVDAHKVGWPANLEFPFDLLQSPAQTGVMADPAQVYMRAREFREMEQALDPGNVERASVKRNQKRDIVGQDVQEIVQVPALDEGAQFAPVPTADDRHLTAPGKSGSFDVEECQLVGEIAEQSPAVPWMESVAQSLKITRGEVFSIPDEGVSNVFPDRVRDCRVRGVRAFDQFAPDVAASRQAFGTNRANSGEV